MDLRDEDAVPIYKKKSDKVLHLRRLGIPYANIAERLGINVWMIKKAARWGKAQTSKAQTGFGPKCQFDVN